MDENGLVVAALCAAWCSTCTEFRAAFDALAAQRPTVRFVWLDVEDDAELCGDVEVANFPTILAFRGERILHYGITVPLAGVVARLVDELALRREGRQEVPEPVTALHHELLARAQEQ
jgi:thioredoxin reductase (NADPH)